MWPGLGTLQSFLSLQVSNVASYWSVNTILPTFCHIRSVILFPRLTEDINQSGGVPPVTDHGRFWVSDNRFRNSTPTQWMHRAAGEWWASSWLHSLRVILYDTHTHTHMRTHMHTHTHSDVRVITSLIACGGDWLTQALHRNSSLTLPLRTLSNTVLLLSIWLHLALRLFHRAVPPFASPVPSIIFLSSFNSPHLHLHSLICLSVLNIHPSLTSFPSFINLSLPSASAPSVFPPCRQLTSILPFTDIFSSSSSSIKAITTKGKLIVMNNSALLTLICKDPVYYVCSLLGYLE